MTGTEHTQLAHMCTCSDRHTYIHTGIHVTECLPPQPARRWLSHTQVSTCQRVFTSAVHDALGEELIKRSWPPYTQACRLKGVYHSSPWRFRWEVTIIHTGIHMSQSVYLSGLWSFRRGVDHHTHRLQSVYLSGLWGFRWGVDHHTHRHTHVLECLPQQPVRLQARSRPPYTQV